MLTLKTGIKNVKNDSTLDYDAVLNVKNDGILFVDSSDKKIFISENNNGDAIKLDSSSIVMLYSEENPININGKIQGETLNPNISNVYSMGDIVNLQEIDNVVMNQNA